MKKLIQIYSKGPPNLTKIVYFYLVLVKKSWQACRTGESLKIQPQTSQNVPIELSLERMSIKRLELKGKIEQR